MYFAISDALDNALAQLVFAVIAILGTANLWYLARIKKDTNAVNVAVNHVSEGTPTLSDRVDTTNQTLEYTQAVLTVYKKESTERFLELQNGQLELRGMIEGVKDDVVKIRESVDRRAAPRDDEKKDS